MALSDVAGQKLVSGMPVSNSVLRVLLEAVQKLERFGWANTDVDCTRLDDFKKEQVSFENVIETLKADNTTRAAKMALQKKALGDVLTTWKTAHETFDECARNAESATESAGKALSLVQTLKVQLGALKEEAKKIRTEEGVFARMGQEYLRSQEGLEDGVGELQATIDNGNRDDYEERLRKLDAYIAERLDLFPGLQPQLRAAVRDLTKPAQAVGPVLQAMRAAVREHEAGTAARAAQLVQSIEDTEGSLLSAKQDLAVFSEERDKNKLLVLRSKLPLLRLDGQKTAAEMRFAAYEREHAYGARVAGESTRAADLVLSRLAAGIAACGEPAAESKSSTLAAREGGALQGAGGLAPPLQKAFADAQNETRRERAAVAQRAASPARAGAGAGAKR